MELHSLFTDLRDHRPAFDEQQRARRIPWLYPDDGCYARSALSQIRLSARGQKTFKQIFVFGNLSLKTPNHPRGLVTWWYHVAPLIKTRQGVFVLDPAVEPRKPLVLEEWLNRFLPNTFDVKVSVCAPSSYSPDSACFPEEEIEYPRAIKAVTEEYFPLEWSRLHHLGRDPQLELTPHFVVDRDNKFPPSSFFRSIIKTTVQRTTLTKELL
jgi:hypothetical protein